MEKTHAYSNVSDTSFSCPKPSSKSSTHALCSRLTMGAAGAVTTERSAGRGGDDDGAAAPSATGRCSGSVVALDAATPTAAALARPPGGAFSSGADASATGDLAAPAGSAGLMSSLIGGSVDSGSSLTSIP